MHEQHPDYFKQHRKNFRYFVSEKEPKLGVDFPSETNYAFGVHSSTSDHLCGFEKQPHYHVLYECETGKVDKKRGFNIPCLYSTFCLLLADCSSLVVHGDIVKRSQKTMQYNVKENKNLLVYGRRKVPVVQLKREKSDQTCVLPTTSLVRFESVLRVPNAATIHNKLEILNDG